MGESMQSALSHHFEDYVCCVAVFFSFLTLALARSPAPFSPLLGCCLLQV